MTAVTVPRLNANEDQVLVVDLFVAENDAVEEGDLLFVVESTKASVEVLAPSAGRVSAIAVAKGAMIDVGRQMCLLTEGDRAADSLTTRPETVAPVGTRITAKARLRAAELSVDVELVPPTNGVVGTKEVDAFAAMASGASFPGLGTAATTGSSAPARALVIGGGGHAATLIDALQGSKWTVIGCTDAEREVGSPVAGGVNVIGRDEIWDALKADGVTVAFIGVGGATSNDARRQVYDKAVAAGFILPPLIAPSAAFGIDSRIGPGSYVLPGTIIGPRCRIGTNVLVNTGSIVCHDSVLDDHVHIAPGAVVAGAVTVRTGSTIGMAATVHFGAKIGRNCLIHNGAAVTGDISDNVEFTREGKRIRR
jgi:sugar O-acyltransferase (sialic acid O-acetyltransferase NeuD family)